MRTTFGRIWSVIRGDKHMVGAHDPPPDATPAAPADTAQREVADPAPFQER